MKIGELFVNLGVKGTEKTVGALTSVRKGLGDLSSMSIEAKAGILGALYGLEQLVSASNSAGTGITNFTALTGMSAKALQQWQYAARQAGVSGEEMAGSIKGVQNSMTNLLLGKGMPQGFGQVASKVGLDANRLRDTGYVLGQLQQYARSVAPDLARSVIGSFGIGEGVTAAMIRGTFNAKNFAKAPSYSDREIGALDKANIAWSNLGNKIQMAVGHINAAHGLQLVRDISNITDKVLKLTEALVVLAEKLKVFQLIGKAFEGWGLILDKVNDAVGGKTSKKEAAEFMQAIPGALKLMAQDLGKAIAPDVKNNPGLGSEQNNNVTITNQFSHDGKDHQKIGDSIHHSIKKAFRQMPAQKQGS